MEKLLLEFQKEIRNGLLQHYKKKEKQGLQEVL
eukprot:CAMPEP_0205849452 /NCGR_PEP_ID=MMETSP1019-20131125/10081_1 /ASSEMBLY_ACC=CAM_ASM_000403 /TAXON_ID=46462 /ORGANISM="Anophryoides haemophila, Strain AH6" /LENGTH=32 /DNA_ID= /DNA_START= /DNA_END= /DNA_ORIENTATION=